MARASAPSQVRRRRGRGGAGGLRAATAELPRPQLTGSAPADPALLPAPRRHTVVRATSILTLPIVALYEVNWAQYQVSKLRRAVCKFAARLGH